VAEELQDTPKPERKLSAQRVMIWFGWAERPPNSKTPAGRLEDLLGRLGIRGGSLAALIWLGYQGIAAINRQSTALEGLGKGTAALVKQGEESTATLKRLVDSHDLNRREQELTTRETKIVGENVGKLAATLGVKLGETTPIASKDVPAKPVGRAGR